MRLNPRERERRLRERIDVLNADRERLRRENASLRQQIGKLTGGIRYDSEIERTEARRRAWRDDKRRLRIVT